MERNQTLTAFILILVTATVFGRILASDSSSRSLIDTSRWATIRALVDDGTYAIGRRVSGNTPGEYRDEGIIGEEGWHTVDMVLRPDTQTFVSSKPPLLPTVLAGEYWLLKNALAWSITADNVLVVRTILLSANVPLLLAYLILLIRLLQRLASTEWGQWFVCATACFGTFLTSFAIVLNNHMVAACTGFLAAYAAFHPDSSYKSTKEAGYVIVSGFLAGFTACVEFPAAILLVLLGGWIAWGSVRKLILFYCPAAALPIIALLVTNYVAIGQLRPAYAEFGGPWYEYSGSYWSPDYGGYRGLDDAGKLEDKLDYALHTLIGHHGLFSLTPVFFLSIAGFFQAFRPRAFSADIGKGAKGISRDMRSIVVGTTLMLVVTVVFYLIRTDNYGGAGIGPRWLFWLTPFLLLSMIPAVDVLGRHRRGRVLCYFLLGVSVLSASYSLNKPWNHPWIYDFMKYMRWIDY